MNLKFKVLNGGKLPTRAAGALGLGIGHIILVWCGVL
jgi:hypothetical protein